MSRFPLWPKSIRRRGLDRWLPGYLRQSCRRIAAGRPTGPVHLLLCVADHYEPLWGGASMATGRERVARWVHEYPASLGDFRDSDGRPPRHSFFFPSEQYASELIDGLAELGRQGFGEVEVHLHHDDDTSENLRRTLLDFRRTLAEEHGLLGVDSEGEPRYGFIHGNWALDNARPDGRWCGVDNELDVLRETGCYADFTLPAAPSACQTRTINSIYYAIDDPDRPRSHETGVPIGADAPPENGLLLIQGPLVLDPRRRKWGLVPRVENGCLQANQPPSIERLPAWLAARVRVPARPDWYFVKLHTHGAHDAGRRALLGEAAIRFHRDLASHASAHPDFHYHYVTAREMYNLARAAAAGWTGEVSDALDFALSPPPALKPSTRQVARC